MRGGALLNGGVAEYSGGVGGGVGGGGGGGGDPCQIPAKHTHLSEYTFSHPERNRGIAKIIFASAFLPSAASNNDGKTHLGY